MNDKRDFDRAVDRWLDDGSDATSPEVIDAVLLAVRSTPQERDFRILRTEPMTMYLRVAAAFAAVVVASAVALYAFGSVPNVGSVPTPDPTTQPTQTQLGGSNGWVAFAADGPERNIYLVREGQPAHRIIGFDSDGLDQICAAFSPDGARLAHGEAEGTADSGYSGAAVIVSDVDAAGNASEALRIDVGGTFPPPCALWSPDGRRVAFGVPTTSPLNPSSSAAGSEVWVVTLEDQHVDVLSDLLATDLEWSPVGSQLAIASGQADLVGGQRLRDGSIRLYDADSGDIRTLVGPSGVSSLTWSPDGSRIAYQRGRSFLGDGVDQEIWMIEGDGSGEYLLAGGFSSIHGIGPVWSPTGDYIAYQRICDTHPDPAHFCHDAGGEQHEVVLVTPDGESEVVLPHLRLPGTDESELWFPFRVIWSPDGRELLYTAWNWTASGEERTALISVPIDRGADPAVLYEDPDLSVYDGDKGRAVPIQSWERHPDE